MTTKKNQGRGILSSSGKFYKRTSIDVDGETVWVRELSTQPLILYREKVSLAQDNYNAGTITLEELLKVLDEGDWILLSNSICDEDGNLTATEDDKETVINLPDRVKNLIKEKTFELSGVPYTTQKVNDDEVAANLKNEDSVSKQ